MVKLFRFLSLSFLFIFLICGVTFASSKEDLIVALNKTYYVGSESYILPEDIRVTAINYLRTHYFTEDDCKQILKCIDDAVAYANSLGTLDISKISADDVQRGIDYAYKAIAIADKAPTIEEMEAKWAEEKRIADERKAAERKKAEDAKRLQEKKASEQVITEVQDEVLEIVSGDVTDTSCDELISYEVDEIDYSKYLNEDQFFEDVSLDDLKLKVIDELKGLSLKVIVPLVLCIIFIIVVIIILIIRKKKRKSKRRNLNEKV